jgi:general secretion pathway protein K
MRTTESAGRAGFSRLCKKRQASASLAQRDSSPARTKVRPPNASATECGSALLAVLWMSAALAAIAFALSSRVLSQTDRTGNSADGLRCSYLASGSVERGIQWMLWGGDYRNRDGSPRFWEYNMPRMHMHYPSGDAVVEMIPESSKLNVNRATPDELYRLLLALTDDQARARDIASAIVEWRSPPSPSLSLASPNFSGSSTFPPRHASFEEIEDLLLVRGVTPELFYGNFVSDAEGRLYARGGLRDAATVWGAANFYDANTVSPVLLESLGNSPTAVAQMIRQRALTPFRSLAELAPLGISPARLGIGGNMIWTLRATARLNTSTGTPSDVLRTASATVKLLDRRSFDPPLHILRYYDDAWSQLAIAPPGPADFVQRGPAQ